MPEQKRIARNIHRGLHDGGVPQIEYEDALKWAFGKKYRKTKLKLWYESWNNLHGELCEFSKNEMLYLMLKRIGEEYEKLQ